MSDGAKPGITTLKKILTAIVTFIVILSLKEVFTSEPDAGFLHTETQAMPGVGFTLIALYLIIPIQLLLHYYYTFKHWVMVNALFYVSLSFIFIASVVVSLIATF